MSAEEAEPVIAASRPRSIDFYEVNQSVKIMMCLILLSIQQRWCISSWTGLLFTLQTGGGGNSRGTKMDSLEMSVSSNVSVSFLSRRCPLWRLAGLGYFQIVSQCTFISHWNFFCSAHNNNINWYVVTFLFYIFSFYEMDISFATP